MLVCSLLMYVLVRIYIYSLALTRGVKCVCARMRDCASSISIRFCNARSTTTNIRVRSIYYRVEDR